MIPRRSVQPIQSEQIGARPTRQSCRTIAIYFEIESNIYSKKGMKFLKFWHKSSFQLINTYYFL
jgi:hypothetical protein